ncbi:MAG TPA: L-type lectin-domain containing protein [Nevskiaceae bacterium]|nr:L-type lectin-domain containing protein [Nevskiaceae bacterium]
MWNPATPLFAIAALLLAPAVEAAFHIMSVREVYAGSVANPNSQYVVLQMRAGSQRFVGGHAVDVYDAAGVRTNQFIFGEAVDNGDNQAYILVATAQAAAEFGVTPDLTMTPVLDRRGGRVCFDTYDCFAWGNYTGPANRCDGTSSANLCITGTPFRATEGLASGRAARRDISAGDPNLLEPNDNSVDSSGAAGDDTGDSARDFDYAPDPRPTTNAGAFPAAPAVGDGLNFTDFDTVGSLRLSRKGPKAEGGVLRLTPVERAPARVSAWHRLRQPVSEGFDTTFRFRITPSETASEGFAFVIQNESNSSLGTGGGKLGYQNITNGVAIEFDTRRSGDAEIGQGDPRGNRVSIHTQGEAANSASEAASLDTSVALPALDDGAVHTARVRYVPGTPGTLRVIVDGTNVVQVRLNLPKRLDLTKGAAFVGFTSGSGKGLGDNDILSWKFTVP